jgi:hypothetical protein
VERAPNLLAFWESLGVIAQELADAFISRRLVVFQEQAGDGIDAWAKLFVGDQIDEFSDLFGGGIVHLLFIFVRPRHLYHLLSVSGWVLERTEQPVIASHHRLAGEFQFA